ncbi:MAG: hypothetical protein R2729_08500 [Bryobacteraceae bacterium]
MNTSPWRDPRVVSVLMLVFLCGSVAGALGLRYASRQQVVSGAGKTWKEGGREISLQRFRTELDLTDDQANEVEAVLDDFMKYYQTLQAQMDEVRADGKERIIHILKPDQQERFKRMLSDLQARQIR